MKLDKKQQKQLTDAIRISSYRRGYKIKSNSIYTVNHNAFIHCDSLRACGAFKSPSILFRKGEVDLTDEYEEQAEYLVKLVDECSNNFMKQNNNIADSLNWDNPKNLKLCK